MTPSRDSATAPGLVDDEHARRWRWPCLMMSSTGSGASQRRSSTRALIPWRGEPSSRPAGSSARRCRSVTIVRSVPSPYVAARPIGTCASSHIAGGGVRREPAAVAGFVQVAGVVERDRLEEDAHRAVDGGGGQAGAQHRGGVVAAGRARRRPGPGCRAARRPRCRCGSGRRSPSGRPGRRPARPSGCGTARARRTAGSPPRRAAGPRRCAGRRGTGSPAPAAARTPRRRGQPEDRLLVEQRVEHPRRRRTAWAARGSRRRPRPCGRRPRRRPAARG